MARDDAMDADRYARIGYYALMGVLRERYGKETTLISPWDTVDPTQQRGMIAFAEAVIDAWTGGHAGAGGEEA